MLKSHINTYHNPNFSVEDIDANYIQGILILISNCAFISTVQYFWGKKYLILHNLLHRLYVTYVIIKFLVAKLLYKY